MKKHYSLCLLLCTALLLTACGTSPAPNPSAATDAPVIIEAPAPVEESAVPEDSLTEEQEAALTAAQAALDELYELGLLSTHHHLDLSPHDHAEITEPNKKATSFNDRLLPPCYYVNCSTEEGNWIAIYVGIDSGKALACSIDTRPQEGDPQLEKDPIDMDGRKLYFYDNFERVMREDMTLEEYCTLLNEYWGFDGYTISGTKYADYGYDTQPPAGDTLMKELMDQPFVTLYFEGDQEGMPMFLEGSYFPGDTNVTFGFFHMVG